MCVCWRPSEPVVVGTDAAAGAEAMAAPAPQYLFDPSDKPALPLRDVPLIVATDESVQGYGALVEHPDDIEIEIVRWPATGWRQVDEDSGDEAGWWRGIFHGEWQDVLFGRNDTVSGHYTLGWSTTDPAASRTDRQTAGREKVVLWHLNYHPDGGQLFFPKDKSPLRGAGRFTEMILPQTEQVIAFWCDGSWSLYPSGYLARRYFPCVGSPAVP